MKKISLLFLLLSINISLIASNSYLYRVHVGSFKREESPSNVPDVPDLKKYILPEGYYCFFSGGYYQYFEGALRQLKEVHKAGFQNATIRVFKNEKLIPVIDGLDHIEEESINPTPIPANEKVDKQIYSLSSKWTLRNRADLYKEIIMPHLTDTTSRDKKEPGDGINLDLDWKLKLKNFGKFWGNKKSKDGSDEVPADKPSNKEENIQEEEDDKTSVNEDEVAENNQTEVEDTTQYDDALLAAIEEGMVEEKTEEVIEENDEKIELNENYVPDEKPEFRIYLTSSEEDGKVPMSIKYVPDIVYTFQKRTLTLYTVGYFESSAEAQADLANYRNEGFYNAKIIGVYKSVVVSQKIADDILARYLKGN